MGEKSPAAEAFDPNRALYLLLYTLFEIHAELLSERFRNAAFGDYSALDGGQPAAMTAYEKTMLELAKESACDQLGQFKERGLEVVVFDPTDGGWYRIKAVGFNTDLLSLVALVQDPADPNTRNTKLLGPTTALAFVEAESEVAAWQLRTSLTPELYPQTLNTMQPLPFINNH